MFRKENFFKNILNVFLVICVRKQIAKMSLSLRSFISCIDELVTSVNVTSNSGASHFEYSSPALAAANSTTQLVIFTYGEIKF